jgi:hypothetical protein
LSSNSSRDSNKNNTNYDNNSSFNPLLEGLTLAQSSATALITLSSEILEAAPKVIDYWFNVFLEPLIRASTATTTEEQKREKVKVE